MHVIDMHCDTILKLYENHLQNKNGSLLENDAHIDLKKMKQGDYLLQNFAMFVHLDDHPHPFITANKLINYYYQEIEKYPEYIKPVFCYQDIIDHQKEGVMSSLLTIEEGNVIENDLSLLQHFYRLGVRMITLTWNFANGIGYPNFTRAKCYEDTLKINTQDGLTDFGIEYIQEMERLGMIIDVSHLSDAGFYDVYHHTTKPFVASHSNARALCHVARNMSDDMILKLASRGGVMGINFCGDFLHEQPGGNARSCIEDMVKHIMYIKDLAGIDCIGLGTDFDGIDSELEMDHCDKMQELAKALEKAGLSQEEIEKVFYKNVLRVYKEILK
ncbi:dipeptidase [Erysipelatoclostridium sp. AM42-17]|uniref:dipeptidase n=1 Tax=Erysipelatoclostridium sp. AM42-17 TaxID=2293102 RepID=UPI000E4E590E|nr:dipeptidase [Erysipelatoclostridium sp. AM42-17]RHS92634.1 membrane dipeptidase [Erysipelatoclostridium sp. AM42-17]